MAPKKKKLKKLSERFRCDQAEGERFHAPVEEVFQFNWWEIFCFPYILCARVWDCCVSLFSGTNQCLVYWMMIQWVVCKITKITTPNPIIFPYYFYMFCQVILLTAFFVWLWILFGRTVLIPYIQSIVDTLRGEEDPANLRDTVKLNDDSRRLSLRKYCFKKGEIFENALKSRSILYAITPVTSFFYAFVNYLITDAINY